MLGAARWREAELVGATQNGQPAETKLQAVAENLADARLDEVVRLLVYWFQPGVVLCELLHGLRSDVGPRQPGQPGQRRLQGFLHETGG